MTTFSYLEGSPYYNSSRGAQESPTKRSSSLVSSFYTETCREEMDVQRKGPRPKRKQQGTQHFEKPNQLSQLSQTNLGRVFWVPSFGWLKRRLKELNNQPKEGGKPSVGWQTVWTLRIFCWKAPKSRPRLRFSGPALAVHRRAAVGAEGELLPPRGVLLEPQASAAVFSSFFPAQEPRSAFACVRCRVSLAATPQ